VIAQDNDDDLYAQLFEAVAQMREVASADAADARQRQQMAEQALDRLTRGNLTPQAIAKLGGMAEKLLAGARHNLTVFGNQTTTLSKALSLIDPAQPENVGQVEVLADAMGSVGTGLRSLAAEMKLVQEVRRRMGGDE
jgi:hypothetical protein